MEDKTYNGWKNYETWNVALWMDNDGNDSYWEKEAIAALDVLAMFEPRYEGQTKEQYVCYDLAQSMKDYYEENNPLSDKANCYADLLNAALSEVNWYEIAEHLMDEVSADTMLTERGKE